MEIEQGKGRALMTAQRYDYSCLMDVRVASSKLKATSCEAWTRRSPFYAANEVLLRFGRKVTKRGPNIHLSYV